MEESLPLEMDNHVLDKEDGCYDNTDATFSDDEEELNNKGKMLAVMADTLQLRPSDQPIRNKRLFFTVLFQLGWSACSLL